MKSIDIVNLKREEVGMLNGLDLFSGIGGLSIALRDWVRPLVYCEIDPYCQGVLLSRQANGDLEHAPIWDDIRTFECLVLEGAIDIIYGGFPCQDISVAGLGKGLEGERSRLFFEIVRLAKEIKPSFIFLENVPAITSRGGLRVVREITEMGYDCRWCVISAASIGALHRRERWFLLAHAKHTRLDGSEIHRSATESICNASEGEDSTLQSERVDSPSNVANARSERRGADTTGYELSPQPEKLQYENGKVCPDNDSKICGDVANSDSSKCLGLSSREKAQFSSDRICGQYATKDAWQEACSTMDRTTDGIPNRVDRIRALGNAVVPAQAREAFRILSGLA
jgi:DNA (cytosine-5)-methyltransferase 1